jgi:hypothetical protein
MLASDLAESASLIAIRIARMSERQTSGPIGVEEAIFTYGGSSRSRPRRS